MAPSHVALVIPTFVSLSPSSFRLMPMWRGVHVVQISHLLFAMLESMLIQLACVRRKRIEFEVKDGEKAPGVAI
jgi:hypothetical protein